MEAAHHLALQRGEYQPLTQEMIAATNPTAQVQYTRPTPPPLVRGGNPESSFHESNPWAMSLQELRAQAIRQQLGEK